ncbi:vacuolar protein sorting-associated protein VTA1 homolog [Lingula anatina]|uniref:Vacuolar protein sorting-associated protein VTA1 homolog n=1 Tax=Lingula anatina TaxID=7574 RepID=A0A1S3KI06_LINAN|nr:vacuolar protein sorting-associated protein VTA1 homolog [Lingula anatina]|eukprot:XP_013421856.1 vacuolar protein sorting-associated protein VTA1 homolog [Lingula anatina]
MSLPPLPQKLKPIQHYLKTANEHDKRDPIVAYYCRMYAVQRGMQLDRTSPECKDFLFKLMDLLEQTKQTLEDNEALTNEVVGQAHLENYALKVFLFADNEDRAGRFSKNVVKSFYTAGMLFDVLSVFGELSEDIENNQRYAKWKATYIHNCLKNGIQPHPGPLPEEGEGEEEGLGGATGGPGLGFSNVSQPGPSHPGPSQPGPSSSTSSHHFPAAGGSGGTLYPPPSAGTHAPSNTPAATPTAQPQPLQPQPGPATSTWTPQPGNVQLNSAQYQKAIKYCKFAGSALQYEDSATAIDNLQKALKLLTTGKE